MKKRSSISLIFYSFLTFLGVFLCSFSCQDHEVPVNPIATEIETLEATVSSASITFGFRLKQAGSVPITEYGTLYRMGVTPEPGSAPNEGDQKEVFTSPLSTNPIYHNAPRSGQDPFVYYRAYAKLQNGTTIYGDVKAKTTMLE